ncbi:hypothetical protein M408DRAFT_241034 [Serendipita vermifera MAFF 305830]|uniref:Uncharacterized protein n=1 Tax=Serendipita vermifera MAFF 305830 TaxID=933852 RepID=A0A0C2XSN4_SERVB|nr:hypothetical protein M408DRAFT_241034 [Serendipita vermifera MAFF 305830]
MTNRATGREALSTKDAMTKEPPVRAFEKKGIITIFRLSPKKCTNFWSWRRTTPCFEFPGWSPTGFLQHSGPCVLL